MLHIYIQYMSHTQTLTASKREREIARASTHNVNFAFLVIFSCFFLWNLSFFYYFSFFFFSRMLSISLLLLLQFFFFQLYIFWYDKNNSVAVFFFDMHFSTKILSHYNYKYAWYTFMYNVYVYMIDLWYLRFALLSSLCACYWFIFTADHFIGLNFDIYIFVCLKKCSIEFRRIHVYFQENLFLFWIFISSSH